MKRLNFKTGLLAASLGLFAASQANAQSVASLFDAIPDAQNTTIFEDDDAENVFRPDGLGGFTQVGSGGSIATGDIVRGIFDIPIIEGQTLVNNEFTGVFLLEITAIGALGGPTGTEANLTFGAAGAAAWSTLVPTVSLATVDPDGPLSGTSLSILFFEDAADNFDIFTDPAGTGAGSAVANATDGTYRMAVDFGTASAFNAETDLDQFDPTTAACQANPLGCNPGVSPRGTFIYDFTVQDENFPGFDPTTNFNGSGFNLVTSLACCSVQSDFQASQVWVQVPEPATIALFGLGLVGLGGMSRKRSRKG